MSSKYQLLYEHLNSVEQNALEIDFASIERILGFTLPASARIHRPWWGNQGTKSGHSHAKAWTNAGWQTSKVDMDKQKLKFVKVRSGVPLSSSSPSDESPIKLSVQEKIIAFLQSQVEGASNREIAIALDRAPAQIYQETILMERRGLLGSTKIGKARIYTLINEIEVQNQTDNTKDTMPQLSEALSESHARFESNAREVMSRHFKTPLIEKQTGHIPKKFDFVSEDDSIVGDSKYYTMVRGQSLPPAKFATIAEYVWLLEKTDAPTKFLVFGNDRRVPEEWLKRYGELIVGVEFYFIDEQGKLEQLEYLGSE